MRVIKLALVVLIASIVQLQAAIPIKSVTVFKGRASVLREFVGQLQAKNQTISFSSLPITLDTKSLKVSVGESEQVLVLGVRYQKLFKHKYDSAALNRLKDEQERLQTSMERIQRDGRELHLKNRDLQDIKRYYRESFTLNLNANRWNSKQFSKFVAFLKGKNRNLYHQWSKLFARYVKVDEKLKEVSARFREMGGADQKSFLNVDVDLKVRSKGRHKIGLSYLVSGASWTPIYDIRIQGKKAILEQSALVNQNTKENWDKCEIYLSNNRAKLNTTVPSIGPDTLSYRMVKKVQTQVKSKQGMSKSMIIGAPGPEEKSMMSSKEQEVVTKVFKVQGKQTIKDGSNKVKLFVAKKSTPYKEELEVIAPKYKLIYRRGDLSNPFAWSLASGKANIFYQGSFIQQTIVEFTPRHGPLHINAGINHDVTLKRWISSNKKTIGVINKERVYKRDISSLLTNYTNKKIVVKLLEQVPISELKSLVIKVGTKSDKFTPLEGYPSWHYRNVTLKANGSKTVKLNMSARAPVDMRFSW
jgi:uncharacterized protein (TIGR02231 family)